MPKITRLSPAVSNLKSHPCYTLQDEKSIKETLLSPDSKQILLFNIDEKTEVLNFVYKLEGKTNETEVRRISFKDFELYFANKIERVWNDPQIAKAIKFITLVVFNLHSILDQENNSDKTITIKLPYSLFKKLRNLILELVKIPGLKLATLTNKNDDEHFTRKVLEELLGNEFKKYFCRCIIKKDSNTPIPLNSIKTFVKEKNIYVADIVKIIQIKDSNSKLDPDILFENSTPTFFKVPGLFDPKPTTLQIIEVDKKGSYIDKVAELFGIILPAEEDSEKTQEMSYQSLPRSPIASTKHAASLSASPEPLRLYLSQTQESVDSQCIPQRPSSNVPATFLSAPQLSLSRKHQLSAPSSKEFESEEPCYKKGRTDEDKPSYKSNHQDSDDEEVPAYQVPLSFSLGQT